MMKEVHAKERSDTAAYDGNTEQGFLTDPPFSLFRFFLIGTIQYERHKIDSEQIYNQYSFHFSLFFVLIDAILIALYLILPVAFKDSDLSKPIEVLNLAMMVAEALIMIFFVLGVNQLAYDNYEGMPFLTKLIIFAYIFITAVQLIAGVLVLFGVTLNGVPYAETIVTVIDKIADGLTLAKEVGTVVFFIVAIVVIKD